ncbi:ferredoxin [Streptomyces sp. NRRL F-5650]|jgi:ferredoxin|uniref:ferredoxin n=1 Tax=Streptomyces sp. NRRL F-5650 TaxID=1463868 RepID=UPI0004C9D2A5|nr:ferredoxin [Streptomyces sp. NRRL F-5650]
MVSGESAAAGRWRLAVDVRSCIGSGACAGSSAHFRMTRDGHAEPREDVIAADDTARDAAECCPAEAITITCASTGELIAPAPAPA